MPLKHIFRLQLTASSLYLCQGLCQRIFQPTASDGARGYVRTKNGPQLEMQAQLETKIFASGPQ